MGYEERKKSMTHARELMRHVTKETEEEQVVRFNNDVIYNRVINHIAEAFYLIATNECFQEDRLAQARELEAWINLEKNNLLGRMDTDE
jgi:hypothetical protein